MEYNRLYNFNFVNGCYYNLISFLLFEDKMKVFLWVWDKKSIYKDIMLNEIWG